MRNIILKLLSIPFVFTVLLLSCGIETYQPIINLAAPMGLTAVNSNNSIFLQFYALNNEDYFTGYYIYMDILLADFPNAGFIVPNSDGTTNKPTIFNVPPMSSVQSFTYFVSKYTNNQNLIPETTYWFMVKAYSEQYNTYGDPSNYTNIVFANTP